MSLHDLTKNLACINCLKELSYKALEKQHLHGYLHCISCDISYPIIYGFPIFTIQKTGDYDFNALKLLQEKYFKTASEYKVFLSDKKDRKLIDPYISFHPFNESTRVIDCFVKQIKEKLRPGDIILDVRNWNGFTGEWLAHTFPEQLIISFWEGNHGPLGFNGFNYWQSTTKRPSNLFIMFVAPNKNWPIQNQAISMIHGYDILHHYPNVTLNNSKRVILKGGVICFPHIHLADSSPSPHFERGGTYIHSQEYKAKFLNLFPDFTATIYGEKYLFNQLVKKSLDITNSYNGFALLGLNEEKVDDAGYDFSINNRFLINPLITIDLLQKKAMLKKDQYREQVEHLLNRHKVYKEHFESIFPVELNDFEIHLLIGLEENNGHINNQFKEMPAEINKLIRCEIIRPYAVSESLYTFYQYCMYGKTVFASLADSLNLWVDENPEQTCITVNELALTREQTYFLVHAMADFITENYGYHKLFFINETENGFDKLFLLSVFLSGKVLDNTQTSSFTLCNEGIFVSDRTISYEEIFNRNQKKQYRSNTTHDWLGYIQLEGEELFVNSAWVGMKREQA